jgi:hypothetical protein
LRYWVIQLGGTMVDNNAQGPHWLTTDMRVTDHTAKVRWLYWVEAIKLAN